MASEIFVTDIKHRMGPIGGVTIVFSDGTIMRTIKGKHFYNIGDKKRVKKVLFGKRRKSRKKKSRKKKSRKSRKSRKKRSVKKTVRRKYSRKLKFGGILDNFPIDITADINKYIFGTKYTTTHRDGKREIGYTNDRGEKTGNVKIWYPSGQIFKNYFYDESGKLLRSKQWNSNGQLLNQTQWHSNSQLMNQKRWHPNGKLWTDRNFNKDGQPRGNQREWNKKGQLLVDIFEDKASKFEGSFLKLGLKNENGQRSSLRAPGSMFQPLRLRR